MRKMSDDKSNYSFELNKTVKTNDDILLRKFGEGESHAIWVGYA